MALACEHERDTVHLEETLHVARRLVRNPLELERISQQVGKLLNRVELGEPAVELLGHLLARALRPLPASAPIERRATGQRNEQRRRPE